MYPSNSTQPVDCTAGHPSSFKPMPSNLDTSGASLHKDGRGTKALPDGACCSESGGSSLPFSRQMGLQSSGDGSTKRLLSPAQHECNLNSGHQAKRARVENIIKGMSSCPGIYRTDVTLNQSDGKKNREESLQHKHLERGDSNPVSQNQFERQYQRLRTKVTQNERTAAANGKKEDNYPSQSDAFTDPDSECETDSSEKHQGWKKLKLMNYFQSKPERMKLMAGALKYELSRAVSRSVDSIFRSMPFGQILPGDARNAETHLPFQAALCRDASFRISRCRAAEEIRDVQTEALSLVVQKPEVEPSDKLVLQSRSGAHPRPDSPLLDVQSPEESLSADRLRALRCLADRRSQGGRTNLDSFETPWSAVKVRSKVNSRPVRSPQAHVPMEAILLESLRLPHVKVECDSLVKNNLHSLNEGLTTNHLKKAKLVFFYTRYPSSQVLKMCFHDVQFTRCITSQLIKWFSNFREFYYIQMEKFARHALLEGVADVRALTVGRESELFRALNTHYNKANDFQVPDRFLEVAQITLREFYMAISMGKDRDPSWKKAIYKTICKLDADVPPEFKSHHSG
uniref:Prospero domain-containing protein n=1 Tax=Salarias fasciatus TaxID=181472 RepID=A0A672GNM0_SALFA